MLNLIKGKGMDEESVFALMFGGLGFFVALYNAYVYYYSFAIYL